MVRADLLAGTERLAEMVPLGGAPLAFLHADSVPDGTQFPVGERACVVAMLAQAAAGATVALSADRFGCGGAGYYLGFCPPRPEIAEFVSTGIPGKMPGERYKKSPELVRAYQRRNPPPPAEAKYAVFKPVADLTAEDQPLVIVYLGVPDELAALVFLANYAREDEAVISPFGSGCHNLVTRPLLEAQSDLPRATLGLFDPSARPFVPADQLSFAAPVALWEEMLANAGGSFLTTPSWGVLRRRLEQAVGHRMD